MNFEHGQVEKIQFIKNLKGSMNCKAFRKYNVVMATYSRVFDSWMHYSGIDVHFIPKEYVKVYNH